MGQAAPACAAPRPWCWRQLGLVDYENAWAKMRSFTDERQSGQSDQVWLLQHPAIYTQGQAGRAEHLLGPLPHPLFASDRGGQVTFHGPGQWVIYPLLDLKARSLGVRQAVEQLEQLVVRVAARFAVPAAGDRAAPGVYVAGKKLASLGLRVRRGCSYHGVALNVDMDLAPFAAINPCGYAGLEMTTLWAQLPSHSPWLQARSTFQAAVAEAILAELEAWLGPASQAKV